MRPLPVSAVPGCELPFPVLTARRGHKSPRLSSLVMVSISLYPHNSRATLCAGSKELQEKMMNDRISNMAFPRLSQKREPQRHANLRASLMIHARLPWEFVSIK